MDYVTTGLEDDCDKNDCAIDKTTDKAYFVRRDTKKFFFN